MIRLKTLFLLVLFFRGFAPAEPISAQSGKPSLESANTLYQQGHFDAAEKMCAALLAKEPANREIQVLKGRLALLGNRFDEAQKRLTKALEQKPDDKEAKALLAEVHYRQDNFQQAALLFADTGRETKARKLESFKTAVPYEIGDRTSVSRLKFIHTDPLPLVSVRVNGGEAVNFLIDTGGGEVIIDTELAKQIGATEFGAEQGTFGGGMKTDVIEGKVDSLTVGDFTVKNVPVNILNTQRFAAAARGKRVSGILGTIFFYHFITTLDYPNGELVLRRKTTENLKSTVKTAQSERQTAVPFQLVGDHLMTAWGSVNAGPPVLLFVDTGLAGMGFTGPQSVIDEAGIKLESGAATEGVGGAGKIKIIPFEVSELSLGDIREHDILAVSGAFPASLENKYGFRIAGLVSHQFLKPYAITMDFVNMKLYFKKTTK